MKTDYNQYPICDVAKWLVPKSLVQLPVVQRGFVWKVSQIERLWDSIFRGYPIGAIMLSREGDKMMLLDGQQRVTSIALGFYNPWSECSEQEKHHIGNANNLPIVWIDVNPRKKTDTQEYVFRVATRSHPWGYQIQHNEKILSVSSRRAAADMYSMLFDQSTYTQLQPTQRLPYDATCPIPLCFLLEAVKNHDDKWLVELCKKNIYEHYRTSGMKDEENYYTLLDSIDFSSLFNVVRTKVLSTLIPAIVLPKELLIDNTDSSPDESTLFVRLNSQGTKIEGEELMYSMFKSECPDTKMLVDSLGMNIIPPSRVITLTSRLILSTNDFISGLSLGQFRKYVQDEDFLTKLREIIGVNGQSPIKEKIECAIEILKYGNVPDVVVKKYIRESPNGFMLLLHWLFENEGVIINETKKKEIASRLYRNHWFGNDFDYYVKKNWNKVSQPDFWCDKYFANEGWIRQYPFIHPDLLLSFLEKKIENHVENLDINPNMSDIWKIWEKSIPPSENLTDEQYQDRILGAWRNFLWKLLNSRDKSLVLLAQRDYINKSFVEFNQIEDLEDTNTPWDWDHIYPNSWVGRKWYIDDRTRSWENRIGNFRAMSLTDNRSENCNLSPAERFDTPNMDYFILENDLKFWKKLDKSHKNIKNNNVEYVLIHAKAIITRTVNIYDNFLKMFGLTPETFLQQ